MPTTEATIDPNKPEKLPTMTPIIPATAGFSILGKAQYTKIAITIMINKILNTIVQIIFLLFIIFFSPNEVLKRFCCPFQAREAKALGDLASTRLSYLTILIIP